jgi:hypothetical protein
VSTLGRVRSVTHTGSTAGYRAFLGRYPDAALSVAILCNVSNANSGGLGASVARVYLGTAATDPPPPQGVAVPATSLAALAGLYADPVTGDPLTIVAQRGGIGTARGPAFIPLSPTEFQVGSQRYVFEQRRGARPIIHVEAWQYSDQRYEPAAEFDRATDLRQYEGEYHSEEAEATLRVRVENGALSVWQRPDRTRTLEPIYADAFDAGAWIVRFRRDGRGSVSGLSLSLGRVYDMRFARVES